MLPAKVLASPFPDSSAELPFRTVTAAPSGAAFCVPAGTACVICGPCACLFPEGRGEAVSTCRRAWASAARRAAALIPLAAPICPPPRTPPTTAPPANSCAAVAGLKMARSSVVENRGLPAPYMGFCRARSITPCTTSSLPSSTMASTQDFQALCPPLSWSGRVWMPPPISTAAFIRPFPMAYSCLLYTSRCV